MTSHQQLAIEYSRLLGDYRGMLRGICTWGITSDQRKILEGKIAELGKVEVKMPIK